MSTMGIVLREAGTDRTVADYLRAVYWSRGHKTEGARESSRRKAEQLRASMTDEQRQIADRLARQLRR